MNDLQHVESLLRKYDSAAPRYTSYPPIPYWGEVSSDQVAAWLSQPKAGSESSLSLYVHVPFCRSRCYYCGCYVIISGKQEPAEAYMAAVHAEMSLVRERLGKGKRVRQFHLGGGTPTFITPESMTALVEHARSSFDFDPDVEMSIEVDPRTVNGKDLEHLRGLGFNRVSLGVQDFDERVQREVNRLQPYERVKELTETGKQLGFLSVNYDLIYGLPYQTRETFAHTLEQVIALRPGRIALYNFAYLPQALPYQRRFQPETLPAPDEKLAIFLLARKRLMESGYGYIGLDHFAEEQDDLTVAWRNGTMRRNFMGYTTQAGTDLLAFGVSGISEFQGRFWQNEKKLNRYQEIVATDSLPVVRGMALDEEDTLRQALISSLFCQGGIDFERMGSRFGTPLREHLEWELETLAPMAEDGLVELNPEGIRITPVGQLFLRNIAFVFDNHSRNKAGPLQFSRTV